MGDVSLMEVFHCAAKLYHKSSHFRQGQGFSFSNHVHHRTIRTQIKDHVSTIVKCECAVEADDIGMSQFRMDFEFGSKLGIPC